MAVEGIFKNERAKTIYPQELRIRAKRMFSNEFYRTKIFLISTKQRVCVFIFFNNTDNFIEKKSLWIICQKV